MEADRAQGRARVVGKLSAAAGVTSPVAAGPSAAVRDDPGKLGPFSAALLGRTLI